jgi:hypothetical protein
MSHSFCYLLALTATAQLTPITESQPQLTKPSKVRRRRRNRYLRYFRQVTVLYCTALNDLEHRRSFSHHQNQIHVHSLLEVYI